jgi:hypothetical protein
VVTSHGEVAKRSDVISRTDAIAAVLPTRMPIAARRKAQGVDNDVALDAPCARSERHADSNLLGLGWITVYTEVPHTKSTG